MSRPVNADADATRARVLKSAIELFARSGPGGASIRDVARGAGVSLAMVHYYYGSKDTLLEACVGAMYSEIAALQGGLERALAEGGSPTAVLDRAVVEAYRFARLHHVAVRMLIRATVDRGVLNPRGRDELLRFLDSASAALAAVTGRRPATLRLPLQSLIFLVARYAVADGAELAHVTHAGPRRAGDAARATRHVETHLKTVARALLLAPAEAS